MLKFKNKKVYFLPQEIFFLNQGLKCPEIVGIMAKIAYPEVIDHAK